MSIDRVSRDVPTDTFALRLRIARFHAGDLSAKEAAIRCGVSGQTWRNWEGDVHSDAAKRPAMLRYIAEQLGVNEDWLRNGGPLGGPGNNPGSNGTTPGYLGGIRRNRDSLSVTSDSFAPSLALSQDLLDAA